MKKLLNLSLLFSFVFVLASCDMATVSSDTEKLDILEDEKGAGEWVSSGAKYTLGADKSVATVKEFIQGYKNMNVETIFNLSKDSIKVFLHNMKEPMYMNRALLTQMFSNYDSIQAKPVYFLPYQIEGSNHSVVQVVSNEVRFLKDGTQENERLLEKFMINKEGKVFIIRQFDAAW